MRWISALLALSGIVAPMELFAQDILSPSRTGDASELAVVRGQVDHPLPGYRFAHAESQRVAVKAIQATSMPIRSARPATTNVSDRPTQATPMPRETRPEVSQSVIPASYQMPEPERPNTSRTPLVKSVSRIAPIAKSTGENQSSPQAVTSWRKWGEWKSN